METMILTVWLGSTTVMIGGIPAQIGQACIVTPGCTAFRDVRPTLDAEFEVRDERVEARPA